TPDRWSATGAPGVPVAATGGAQAEQADTSTEADVAPAVGAGEATGAEGASPATGARLGRGALEALVRDFLAARPEESFGPAAIGTAIGRSQGAVSNSLAKMAAGGAAVLVADKPRRYRIARRD
ncbi:MAG: hypothetical protein ACRDWN_09775, partial [Acidimicrobiales bacterium]